MTNLGVRLYGLASVMLGVVGLGWADFALVWQPVPAAMPGRTALAYLTALVLIAGGIAINIARTASFGAIILTAVYGLGALLLHVPRIVGHPMVPVVWGGLAEQLALTMGGLLAYTLLTDLDTSRKQMLSRIGWIVFGLCAVMFGVEHLAYPVETAAMVPKYLPPQQMFWVYLTAAGHFAAGLAIITGIQARLGAILLTLMFAVFSALVHIPLLLTDTSSHMFWTMNAINLALTGAAWVVADSLRNR